MNFKIQAARVAALALAVLFAGRCAHDAGEDPAAGIAALAAYNVVAGTVEFADQAAFHA